MPFTAWGEVVFITVQNAVLVILVHILSDRSAKKRLITTIGPFFGLLICLLFSPLLNYTLLTSLFNFQTAILVMSRVPQIIKNYQEQSTGELSFITTFLTLAGGLGKSYSWNISLYNADAMN